MAYLIDRENVTWRVVDGEAVVVHAATSDYFSLNATGTWLWTRLEAAATPAGLAAALARRYGIDVAVATADVGAFLEQLAQASLVARDGATVTAGNDPPAEDDGPSDPYETPELVRFGNLETLILSGE
jgi:hypothetical protein